MSGTVAVLDDRAVLEVRGEEAASFLQRLVTSDVEIIEAGAARYAALLSPQGKVVADFLLFPTAAGFLLDAPLAVAPELLKRLRQYRLRARLDIEDRTGTLSVVAGPPGSEAPDGAVASAADPRDPSLWRRSILPRDRRPAADPNAETARDAARLAAGVPEGGRDFIYGDAFPHEANLDRLGGVDFRKGCYVGQEVVSRVHHRGTARRRIVPVTFQGPPPPAGTPIKAGATEVGTMGSAAGDRGLASVRTDRASEAEGPLDAGGVAVVLHVPAWAASPNAG